MMCPDRRWCAWAAVLLFAGSCSLQRAQRSDCVLTIGTSADYAPFSSGAADGTLTGLDIDIAKRLSNDLGCRPRFVYFAWPDLHARFADGAFRVVMSGITMRTERALAGRFTRPYATAGAVAIVRGTTAGGFASAADLNHPGVRVAVNAGGHLERVARSLFPRAVLESVTDNQSLRAMLLAGNVDAVVSDSAEAQTWLRGSLHVVGPFTHDHKAFWLQPGEADLARKIDAWLVVREQDGWLQERRRQWLPRMAGLDASEATRQAVASLIRLRWSLMPAVAAAKQAAALPIDDPVQEQRVLERAAAAAERDPERALAVYRLLIETAKAIQCAQPAALAEASLEDVRAAIARIDEQLLREIDRLPVSDAAAWRRALDAALDMPGVDWTVRARLAALLAR